jgi:hypothetical protein
MCLTLLVIDQVESVKHRLPFVLLLTGLVLFILPVHTTLAYPEQGQITIVFDMSHEQPLSPVNRNFTQAIDFFQNHTEFFVRIHDTGELMAENLSRAHILVIPNPGINYSQSELDLVTDFVKAGGGLFLLGDYQIQERPLGNPEALNQILDAISEDRIQFTTTKHDNETQGDTIVDSVNNLTLSYNIQIEEMISTTDSRELIGSNLERLIIAGGSLTTSSNGLIISRGASSSTAVTIGGEELQSSPPWLAAFWRDYTKIVLCTSTTMFSDTQCVGTNSSWFQSADNSLLWYNIFKWFSRDLIHDPTPIMIVFTGLALIAGIGLLVYSLSVKKRGR